MTLVVGMCGLLLSSGPLVMQVRSPEKVVLVGEPIKLVVEWSARGTLHVPLAHGTENIGTVMVRVNRRDGTLLGVYRERGQDEVVGRGPMPELREGAPAITSIYLVSGAYVGSYASGYVFERPGAYTLTVEYRGPDGLSARSNALSFEVEEPSGQEGEVFTAIRERPSILRGGKQAEDLLEQYPASRYLQFAKITRMVRWQHALVNGQDPHTGAYQRHDGSEMRRIWKADQARLLATQFLATDNWGVFDEERLWWTSLLLDWSGDKISAGAARRELRARFPGTKGAKEVEGYPDQ